MTGRLRCAVVLLGPLLAALGSSAQDSTSFSVVVNAANPVSGLTRAEVSKLFMKRTSRWDDGVQVKPVDQLESSTIRRVFSQEIHRKDVMEVKGYWATKVFSGTGTPPPELDSDESVLSYVRSNPGAVGYVSARATLGEGVTRLRLTD